MNQSATRTPNQWVLILGASSGFGGATAVHLARQGYDVLGVHLDRRTTLADVERVQESIRSAGRDSLFFNVNAADPERRAEVLAAARERFLRTDPPGRIVLLFHSLAFGTLKPFIAPEPDEAITQKQLEMTLDVMANSLVYWSQDLARHGLFADRARILAMTSEGSTRVWRTYGAVSAAKCALESHIRQLALELAPRGVTVNAIRAGVTDTPALRKIPGNEEMIVEAQKRNPGGRMTTPEDIARAVAVFIHPDTQWMTGNVIGVDGGEGIA